MTDVRLKIHDLDALATACEALGLELQQGKRQYAWWGSFVGDSSAYGDFDPRSFGKGDHAIKIAGTTPRNGSGGPWEIGVVAAKDGDGFQLVYDAYGSAGNALTAKVGPQANRLRQEYACAVATKKATATLARKGFRVERENLSTGAVRLRLRRR